MKWAERDGWKQNGKNERKSAQIHIHNILDTGDVHINVYHAAIIVVAVDLVNSRKIHNNEAPAYKQWE